MWNPQYANSSFVLFYRMTVLHSTYCHTHPVVYDSECISLHRITTRHDTPLHLWTQSDLFRRVRPTVEFFIHSFIVNGWRKGRARSEPDGTRWRTGGCVKGKLANGVGSQYSHATSECGLSSITKADAHTSAASSQLNWRPHRFEWTRPFLGKTKSGFCACAITFLTSCNCEQVHSSTNWVFSKLRIM